MTGNMQDQEADPRAAEDDDQSLGAALGRAISAQVDAAAMPALLPLSTMADRAAARARMQAARRAVVAVAASISVVLGGVVGWNALNRGDTTTVFVTSADPSAPSTETAPVAGGPESSPPTGTEGDARSQLAAADTGPNDSMRPEAPTPQDLSTGPVLQWTEVDPGFLDLFGFESAGDGRVIAYAWPEGVEQVLHGERAVVTTNGTDWDELPLPDGLIPDEIDIAGDRWLVTGRYRSFDAPGSRPDRAFFSDDQGTTWTELQFEIPPDPALASPYLQENLRVAPALVSGERMVLVLQGHNAARIFSSDGSSVELAARYTGGILMGVATADGFALTLLDGPKETTLTSPDGLVWTEEQSFEYGYSHRAVTADGTIWRTVSEPLGSFSVQRARDAETPTTVVAFEGLHPTGTLAAGPAGVAVTAFGSLGGQLEAGTIGGLPVWRDRDRTDPLPDAPLWVGWSADGTDWGWQSLLDAFGITEGEAWAQLAVSRDFVIARVETIVVPTPEETASMREDPSKYEEYLATEAPAPRWFVARLS